MALARPEFDESLLSAIAERRLALRVPVSIRLSVWDGFRRRRAEVLDLSLSGARLRFAEPVTADRRPWLWLPAGLGGRFAHPIGSEVAWTDSISGAPTGHCQVGLAFRRFPLAGHARLRCVLADLLSLVADDPHAREHAPPPERRTSARVAFTQRVIARGAGAPAVLLGRDLSASGISVETRRALAIGDLLQIALHAGGDLPLVVSARVVRALGEQVWALGFANLNAMQRERIDALVRDQLAPHAAGGSLLVSEVRAAN